MNDPANSPTVSLRDAIKRADAAFGPVTITFDSTVFAIARTIALTDDIPALQGNHFGTIAFVAPAAGVSIKSHIVYGNNGHGEPVPEGNTFIVASGVTASFSHFTFKQLGFANAGALTLANSTITGNTIVGSGAGIYNQSTGLVTLLNSSILDNTANVDASPGGTFGGYGGGIENQGILKVLNCTIAGNSARRGAGVDNEGTATLTDSTLSENGVKYGGGGGGVYNEGTVTISDSTISGNQTNANGGGIYNAARLWVNPSQGCPGQYYRGGQ